MNTLIIYGSQYGTAKQYAEKFSELVHLPVTSYDTIKSLAAYDRIVYFGGLYAGSVKGLKHTLKLLQDDTKLIIATIGLSDVHDEQNIRNIRKSLHREVPEKLLCHADLFHLRGGIDYQKLTFTHRIMMTLLYNKVKRLPEDKKTPDVITLMETFHSKADFVDYNSLNQMIGII